MRVQSLSLEMLRVLRRLQVAEGRVRALRLMIGRGTPCEDVLMQLTEFRAELEDVAAIIIEARFREVIPVAFEAESIDEAVRECSAVMKYARR
jgi:DNA-binding FrmR family transcriptional regulator